MQGFYKNILLITAFLLLSHSVYAQQTRIMVSPVTIPTVNSVVGIYPNIPDMIANDVIDGLNKNLRFDALDLATAENLLGSYGLSKDYKKFLQNYKDKGIIDYKPCDFAHKKLRIDKIILIASGLSTQGMLLERPFWYKMGLTELEPIRSYYMMNVSLVQIDTRTCLLDFEKTYEQKFKVDNFEVTSNSLNDNLISTEKIKMFSREISNDIVMQVFINTNQNFYKEVNSSIITNTTNNPVETKPVGQSLPSGDEYLKNRRKENFKKWIKEKVDY
ncbi:MAG TPA: hypothetical protein P5556_11160 [Candidatus Gastranaerophilales bacterium]|nr:hypothetical protein [Candidatus Gastranaerophilales bacterium]